MYTTYRTSVMSCFREEDPCTAYMANTASFIGPIGSTNSALLRWFKDDRRESKISIISGCDSNGSGDGGNCSLATPKWHKQLISKSKFRLESEEVFDIY